MIQAKIMIIALPLIVSATLIHSKTPKNQAQIVTLLHQGISMGLEANLEKKTGYHVKTMQKTANEPWTGIVIAKSGRAYKASCEIETLLDETFCLPCDLQPITKEDIK